MTVVTTRQLGGSPLTVDDLETMPDDGHRYELLDGVLIVSPAPETRHQVASSPRSRVTSRSSARGRSTCGSCRGSC